MKIILFYFFILLKSVRDRLNAYVLSYDESNSKWVNNKRLLWPHISDMIYSTTRAYELDFLIVFFR